MFNLAYIGTTGFEFGAKDVHFIFSHSEFPPSKNERARILKLLLSLFILMCQVLLPRLFILIIKRPIKEGT